MGEIGVTASGPAVPARRPDDVEPFLRGCAFGKGGGASYPRADPRDRDRLPADTWGTATIPAGVRLEFVGDATAVDIGYVTLTDDLGYRGKGAGTTFAAFVCDPSRSSGGVLVDAQPAVLGEDAVRLSLDSRRAATPGSSPDARYVVYLPEGMKPTVLSLTAVGGSIAPAPRQPRWIVYGDSIAEGWTATAPALGWPAVAGRWRGLDTVNMGYAGAARGEIASAEQIAKLADASGGATTPVPPGGGPAGGSGDPPVSPAGAVAAGVAEPGPVAAVSVSHGTNCWTRIPHSAGMVFEGTAAFLDIVRQGHPDVPIVVVSPVIRPDAESTPNRLGATLADLRAAIESCVRDRIAAGEGRLVLVEGGELIGPEHLADGIHPNDAGHQVLADVIGSAVVEALAPSNGETSP